MLLAPEDVSDYIFQELAPVSRMYDHLGVLEFSHAKTPVETEKPIVINEMANKRTNILNIHMKEGEYDVILREAILPFITKTKGIIRRTQSSYLEVEGPFHIKQSCFVDHNEHFHCEWKITTLFGDLQMVH